MPRDYARAAMLLGGCLWLTAAGPLARLPQQTQPAQQPVFRGGVDLVALDVTVVDKNGKPVKGLNATDFVVTLQGQKRPVRVVDYQEFGTTPGAEVAATSNQTTNQTPEAHQASRGGRVIVLLIDDISTKAGRAKELMVSAERMLTSFDPADLVGIATTSGRGAVVNPTRDRAALLAGLKSKSLVGKYDDVTAPFYISVPEAIDIERDLTDTLRLVADRECSIVEFGEQCPTMVRAAGRRLATSIAHLAAQQLAAYTTVIEALKTAPKPRVVIALSAGLATGTDGNMLDLEPVGRAAAEVGVQFYALTEVDDGIDMADGPATPCLPPCISRPAARRIENNFLTSGVQIVAAAAGGEAFKVIGQADRFFTRILAETSGVYRLGVEAPLLTERQRMLNVKVSVNRSGVTTRTNRHALVPTVAAEPMAIDAELRTRIAQGGVAFGVPIALATAIRQNPTGGGLQLGVNVQVPGTVTGPLTMMFTVVDTKGVAVQSGRREVPANAPGEDYWVSFPVPLTTGDYHLRFAVADASGNIGSVEHRVTAALVHAGSFSASNLFMGWKAAGDGFRFLALETLPADATTLQASIELYPDVPAAPAASTRVRFEVARLGEPAALLTLDVTPGTDGAHLIATTEIPTGTLEPGTYTIRATILETGTATGTVSAVFRKIR